MATVFLQNFERLRAKVKNVNLMSSFNHFCFHNSVSWLSFFLLVYDFFGVKLFKQLSDIVGFLMIFNYLHENDHLTG